MEFGNDDAVVAFGALAQDTRLSIYRLLVEQGPDGLAAGAIADALKLAPATLSFHLAQLRGAGLITQRRASRSLIYAADIARMNAVIAFLTARCCGGATEKCLPQKIPATKEASHARPKRRAAV